MRKSRFFMSTQRSVSVCVNTSTQVLPWKSLVTYLFSVGSAQLSLRCCCEVWAVLVLDFPRWLHLSFCRFEEIHLEIKGSSAPCLVPHSFLALPKAGSCHFWQEGCVLGIGCCATLNMPCKKFWTTSSAFTWSPFRAHYFRHCHMKQREVFIAL